MPNPLYFNGPKSKFQIWLEHIQTARKIEVRPMIEGIDYNVEPEPIKKKVMQPSPSLKLIAEKAAHYNSPKQVAKRARQLEKELDLGDPELFDPEDENRLLGTDDNENHNGTEN